MQKVCDPIGSSHSWRTTQPTQTGWAQPGGFHQGPSLRFLEGSLDMPAVNSTNTGRWWGVWRSSGGYGCPTAGILASQLTQSNPSFSILTLQSGQAGSGHGVRRKTAGIGQVTRVPCSSRLSIYLALRRPLSSQCTGNIVRTWCECMYVYLCTCTCTYVWCNPLSSQCTGDFVRTWCECIYVCLCTCTCTCV